MKIYQVGMCLAGVVLAGLLRGDEKEGADPFGGLGSSEFAERARAELALREAGREAIPALKEAINSPDPQVRLTAQRILDHILSDPDNIPTRFRSLGPMDRATIEKTDAKWRESVVVAAKNIDGRAGTSGNFAQSFVPGCDVIAAVEVCTYPLSGGHGWLRLDLCRDDAGRPSAAILGRSWVYAPKGHSFPHGGYIVHEFDEVSVEPGELIWMVYAGFRDADCDSNLINYGLSFQVDDYPAGKLWRSVYPAPKGDEDVKFRILEKAAAHPSYRAATVEDRKSFPPAEEANAPWKKLLGKN